MRLKRQEYVIRNDKLERYETFTVHNVLFPAAIAIRGQVLSNKRKKVFLLHRHNGACFCMKPIISIQKKNDSS